MRAAVSKLREGGQDRAATSRQSLEQLRLGDRAFLRGEGVERVAVEGSQWQVVLVPLDQVRAIAGVESLQALAAKQGTRGEQIGTEVKR